LAGCSTAKNENEETLQELNDVQEQVDETADEEVYCGEFLTENMELLSETGELCTQDYFIKRKVTVSNGYYIDDEKNLWGYGTNDYGQLGIGEAFIGETVKEPVLIAKNIVSVDASWMFSIYLTEDGKLYGMGSNMLGLLGQEYSKETQISEYGYAKVASPVLLLEDVAYARAGREAIVALKTDGTVWWWGQYRCTYSTKAFDSMMTLENYWKAEEDETNPIKMYVTSPKKILEDCVYVTTGDYTGAAIGTNGELYTWGLNIFGECGTKVTEDDYVRTPIKVLDHVRMVWLEKIELNSLEKMTPNIMHNDTKYDFNSFVLLENGKIVAAGENVSSADGGKEKVIGVTGDIEAKSTHIYSDEFLPVEVKLYSEEENRKKLSALKWGMSGEEVEKFLQSEGLQFYSVRMDGEYYLGVEDSRYILFFDEADELEHIELYEGGSRDLKFHIGMRKEEVEALLGTTLLDGSVIYEDYRIYWTKDKIEDSYYGFVLDGEMVSQIWEKGILDSDTAVISETGAGRFSAM